MKIPRFPRNSKHYKKGDKDLRVPVARGEMGCPAGLSVDVEEVAGGDHGFEFFDEGADFSG